MLEQKHIFLAVPLPKRFRSDFLDIQQQILSKREYLIPVDSKIPHITLFNFGNQSKNKLSKISNIVENKTLELNNTTLNINELGTFKKGKIVYFFKVSESPQLSNFHNHLKNDLQDYISEHNMVYIPHLTIAKSYQTDSRINPLKESEIKNLFNVSWSFRISELGLYGKDMSKPNPQQEMLVRIPIK